MVRRTVAILAMAAVAAACSSAEDGGPEATEALVLETCAPGATPVEVQVCQCAYRELAERFDEAELARLDRQLRDDPETVPPAVQEAALSCAFAPVSPPATKATTTTTTTEPEPVGNDDPDEGDDGDGRGRGGRDDETTSTTDRDP